MSERLTLSNHNCGLFNPDKTLLLVVFCSRHSLVSFVISRHRVRVAPK